MVNLCKLLHLYEIVTKYDIIAKYPKICPSCEVVEFHRDLDKKYLFAKVKKYHVYM